MARAKKYLKKDVIEAARERVKHIYDIFDTVVVMFSGGKDSLACLELVRQYHEENNLGKVIAVFRHEEVINPSIIDFVEQFRHMDWLELHWFCFPQKNNKFILGRREVYIEWDPTREWVGEQPEWAITAEMMNLPTDGSLNQENLDDIVCEYLGLKGKVAFITGIRAAESLVRFRSVTQKLNENYITSIEGNTRSRVKLCKPIYDWQQSDVLKFLYETGAGWCPVYEAQDLAGVGLRVSTALHIIAAKKIDKMPIMEPEFYEKIVKVFPEMQDQARYWKDFDQKALIEPYMNRGFEGVYAYVDDHTAPEDREMTLDRIELWKGRHERDPKNYPIQLLLETIAYGRVRQRLAGVYVNSKSPTKAKEQ